MTGITAQVAILFIFQLCRHFEVCGILFVSNGDNMASCGFLCLLTEILVLGGEGSV